MMLALSDFFLVGGSAFLASLIGGVTGYGTGLLLPPVLVPLIGAEAVVPVIALSALLTNSSRVAAYRDRLDLPMMRQVALFALPATLLGAYGLTRLSGPEVEILIGTMLIVLVPLRYLARQRGLTLTGKGLSAAAMGYGLLNGGTAGSGVILITILLAGGLSGPGVIATDAAISFLLGIGKTGTFLAAGALDLRLILLALMIGVVAVPGAFIARRFAHRLGGTAHLRILDAVVILGGTLLVLRGAGALG